MSFLSNYRFLVDAYPSIARQGELAERSVFIDPANTLGEEVLNSLLQLRTREEVSKTE